MAARKRIRRNVTEAVSGGLLTTLTVAPATATKANAATQQYTVTGVGPYGAAVPLLASDITWTISDAAGGTISATGLWTAAAVAATYQVRATHVNTVYDEADAVASG